MLMTKAMATRYAQDRGLAVYRNDTLASLKARIEAENRAQKERRDPVRRAVAVLARLGHARPILARPQRQLWLPLRLPHDLSLACGMAA